MTTLSAPLVGMRFRPPALTIVQGLGMDEPLLLKREPDNQFDPNAIQVWLPSGWENTNSQLMEDAREEALALGQDNEFTRVKDTSIFLGFIAATHAKDWAPFLDAFSEEEKPFPPSRLTFSPTGSPQVTMEMAGEDSEEEEEDGGE